MEYNHRNGSHRAKVLGAAVNLAALAWVLGIIALGALAVWLL